MLCARTYRHPRQGQITEPSATYPPPGDTCGTARWGLYRPLARGGAALCVRACAPQETSFLWTGALPPTVRVLSAGWFPGAPVPRVPPEGSPVVGAGRARGRKAACARSCQIKEHASVSGERASAHRCSVRVVTLGSRMKGEGGAREEILYLASFTVLVLHSDAPWGRGASERLAASRAPVSSGAAAAPSRTVVSAPLPAEAPRAAVLGRHRAWGLGLNARPSWVGHI